MSARRRSSSPDSDTRAPSSPASSDENVARQSSLRVSRNSSGNTTQARVTISGRAGGGGRRRSTSRGRGAAATRTGRTRRPTPVVRRNRYRRASSPESDDASDSENLSPVQGPGRRSANRRRDDQSGSGTASNQVSRFGQLRWFERLIPEFLLGLSAPITGYEAQVDSEVEDDKEYEILERQRLKRNKRVRRRLLAFMLIATAASLFFYSRGRVMRKVGVKAAVSSMKHRIEDGLSKTIQETMGK